MQWAIFFKSPQNWQKLAEITKEDVNIPATTIKLDHDKTLITVKYSLYYLCIQSKKAMGIYELCHNISIFPTASD